MCDTRIWLDFWGIALKGLTGSILFCHFISVIHSDATCVLFYLFLESAKMNCHLSAIVHACMFNCLCLL